MKSSLTCIGNTLNYEKFQSYISEMLQKREAKLLEKRQLTMDVDGRVAKIINSSQMVTGNHKLVIVGFSQ